MRLYLYILVEPNERLTSTQSEQYEELEQKFNLSHAEIVRKLLEYKCPFDEESEVGPWRQACQLFVLLMEIKLRISSSIDVQKTITVKESRQIENGILSAIDYGLTPLIRHVNDDNHSKRLLCSVNILMELMSVRHYFAMHPNNELRNILITMLEAIFTLKTIIAVEHQSQLIDILTRTCQLIQLSEYFKVLFFIKGSKQHSVAFQMGVHHHLLYCLALRGGFVALCTVLLPSADGSSTSDDKLPPSWQGCTVISNIIAHKGHKRAFYHAITQEICRFLCEEREASGDVNPFYVVAAVHCLNKLYELPHEDVQGVVIKLVLGGFDVIAQPTDLVKGVIVYDEKEFNRLLGLTHVAFCTSGPSDVTLPSKLLAAYLPLFVQLYAQFQRINQLSVMERIGALVVRCLSNRNSTELNQLIESIIFQEYKSSAKTMHAQVAIRHIVLDESRSTFSLQIEANIAADDVDADVLNEKALCYDPSSTLVHILKESNHNILIYDIFLHLLQLFSSCILKPNLQSTNTIDFIEDFNDLTTSIEMKFRKNYMIINALNELIGHKPFHTQFQENPQKLVDLFEQILREHMTNGLRSHAPAMDVGNDADEIILIILSLIQEFLHKTTDHERNTIKRLYGTLNEFSSILSERPNTSTLIQKKIALILTPPTTKSLTNSAFLVARTLIIESTEPHLKVYGMSEMIKLISSRDAEATANAHTVLAIAMKLLKDGDSYVFLNCIRLLITLVNVIDSTVLDTLIADYHQEEASSIGDTDFRLKVGETIVKVTEGLGENKLNETMMWRLMWFSYENFLYYRSVIIQIQEHFNQLLLARCSSYEQWVPHIELGQFGYNSSHTVLSGASILPRGMFYRLYSLHILT